MCLALAGAWAVVPSAGQDVIASRSFVSAYPLSDPSELDRYSLTTGGPLGVLIRVPPLRAGAANVTGSTPHPLTGGGYMLTLDQDPACRSSHGPCHPRPGDCLSQVETLDPNSRRSRVLFSVTGSWRVLDAVPSPDGRSVALLEDECWSAASARLEVRDLASGHTQLLTDQLSVCGLGSDVSWNPKSTEVVFAYGRHPDLNAPPAGCELATAPADRISGPSSWRLIRVEASCGFDAGTFDSAGIVAIVGCSDGDGGTASTLLQYNHDGRVLARRSLDSFDPPQYGLQTQLESDAAAHTVLVSEIITDDPDVSDVWTFDGRNLRHVGNYFGQAILAEP